MGYVSHVTGVVGSLAGWLVGWLRCTSPAALSVSGTPWYTSDRPDPLGIVWRDPIGEGYRTERPGALASTGFRRVSDPSSTPLRGRPRDLTKMHGTSGREWRRGDRCPHSCPVTRRPGDPATSPVEIFFSTHMHHCESVLQELHCRFGEDICGEGCIGDGETFRDSSL